MPKEESGVEGQEENLFVALAAQKVPFGGCFCFLPAGERSEKANVLGKRLGWHSGGKNKALQEVLEPARTAMRCQDVEFDCEQQARPPTSSERESPRAPPTLTI